MGRIKTLQIKRVTHELMRIHRGKFSGDYGENKKVVNRLISTPSKKLKNVISGYVTRLVKKGREPKKRHRIEENLDKFYK
jgi:small subunit ribosomal protein S17e